MKTLYIADDGTEFDDEYACEEYERHQAILPSIKETRFWRSDGEVMTVERWMESADECDYMYVANESEARIIKEFLDDVGICSPWDNNRNGYWMNNGGFAYKAGRYYYSHDDDEWRDFDELKKKVEELEAQFSLDGVKWG